MYLDILIFLMQFIFHCNICFTDPITGVIITIPPTITMGPSDTTADLYGEVELTCVASGNPQPIIHWFKDGKRILMSNADPPMLLIEEMGLDYRGLYHCEATNTAGKYVSVSSLLNIKSKFTSLTIVIINV